MNRVLSRTGFKLRSLYWNEAKYRNGSVILEVKSKMGDIPKLNPWTNISRVTLASADTRVLNPEVFLIHICLHAERHFRLTQAAILLWWFDITELLKRYREKFDWDYVIRIVREHKVEKAVHGVLHMAREDFRACILFSSSNEKMSKVRLNRLCNLIGFLVVTVPKNNSINIEIGRAHV